MNFIVLFRTLEKLFKVNWSLKYSFNLVNNTVFVKIFYVIPDIQNYENISE